MKPETLRRILTTPGWHRSLLIRRTAAVLLITVALVLGLRQATQEQPQALVFNRDIQAGESVSSEDVEKIAVPPHLLPAAALVDAGEVDGRVIVAATDAGEIATKHRFVETSITATNETEVTHLVPVRLAEPDIIPLLHHGDSVTIVSQSPEDGQTQVVATGGRVILASTQDSPGTLLVALPADIAREVAAASLITPLALTVTGDRAITN